MKKIINFFLPAYIAERNPSTQTIKIDNRPHMEKNLELMYGLCLALVCNAIILVIAVFVLVCS